MKEDTQCEIQTHLNIDEVLTELFMLREQVHSLQVDNDFLEKQNALCKQRCSEFSKKVMALESEIADLRFTHNYLTAEEAGRQFARELTGRA